MNKYQVIAFVVLAFIAVGVVSIGAAAFAVNRIEQKTNGDLEFHTGTHAQILAISNSFSDAVQESLAYVLSGETVEKDEAIELHVSLPQDLQAFAEATRSHFPGGELKLALTDKIAEGLNDLVTRSNTMFREYETTDSVAPATFASFEAAVDGTGSDISHLVQIESADIDMARTETLAVIAKAEQLILGQAIILILVILLAAAIVARVLNNVFTNREALQEQLLQSQKMEVVGQLAGGVAHDFNNYLTIISGATYMIQNDDKETVEYWVTEIEEAGNRAAALTAQLLAFAKKQVLDPQVIDINTVVEATSPLLRRTIGEHIELEFVPDDDIGTVSVDRSQLEQVIVNLVLNARDAMPEGGTVTIETGAVHLSDEYASTHPNVLPGNHTMLAVSDTGTGIEPAIRERIFEPFATTKDVGKGTGLGLSTVYGIVTQNGGIINVYSEQGHGTTFKIYFRCVDTTAAAIDTVALQEVRAEAEGLVLLVEDDESVRRVTKAMLESIGFEVVVAEDGVAGVSVLRQRQDISLLLTDITMPNMGGIELANKAREMQPGIKVLYMSGYTQNGIVHHGRVDPGFVLLRKPFSFGELNRKLIEVLAGDEAPAP